jgi:small-conductance mechanosensitive channel
MLGLSEPQYEALLKLAGLVVHIMLIVVVLQIRAPVASRLRARPGATGLIAATRNGAAAIWHWVALFYLVAGWLVWAVELPDGFRRVIHVILVGVSALALGRIALIIAHGSLDRVLRLSPQTLARHPGIEGRIAFYRPLLRGALTLLITVTTLVGVLEAWGLGTLGWLLDTLTGQRLLGSLASLVLTIVLAVLAWEAANGAVEGHLARLTAAQQTARSARLRTLLPMLRTSLLVLLAVIVGLMVLSDIGVNIAPLLAGAGVLGIAIGFGSQKLVQDVITGLFLLLENTIQVGDVVTLGGLSGVVEHLSIRSIRLRAEDGSVHVIPFSAVTTVTNMTRDFGFAVIEATVSYEDDYDKVAAVMRDIVAEMRAEPRWAGVIRDDVEILGLDRFGDQAIVVKARIRCGPFDRWSVLREFNRRMKVRFDAQGIEIPSPRQRLVVSQPVALGGGDATPNAAASMAPDVAANREVAR